MGIVTEFCVVEDKCIDALLEAIEDIDEESTFALIGAPKWVGDKGDVI